MKTDPTLSEILEQNFPYATDSSSRNEAQQQIIKAVEEMMGEVIGKDDYIGFKMPLDEPYEVRLARNNLRSVQHQRLQDKLKEWSNHE